MTVRRTAYFSGRVQGVGFRYTACDVARRFRVTGRVRNLRDGRVELIAEGERQEVESFVDAVREAMHGFVWDVSTVDSPAQSKFSDFSVGF